MLSENDLSWLLRGMVEHSNLSYDEEKKLCDEYAYRIKLWLKHGYGDIYSFDEFYNNVKGGSLNDCDGEGEFIDEQGYSIEDIYCDCEWLKENKPENSNYIMWYAK